MLHTLMSSPFQCDYYLLLRMLQPDDDLLLMQDGVLAGLQNNRLLPQLLQSPARLWALEEDVVARGLTAQISSKITVIDYNDFVMLTVKQQQQMPW
ncbi:sulfurtransferase complex subunit TusB [Mixta theicola]|uniref:Protein TusB n=1 Tax=Mixta theicola TaxID=1458355 RepID=A0A2K1QA85_9GAMM|nr:sulfurtransferase complex subunit TusB [Mixta theicola]PNS11932.1 sulfurtransferase complex subunit TusB [Mixta theicola]GLR07863.1 protein TusB [Mixta theicola]